MERAVHRYLSDLGLTKPTDWDTDGYDPNTGQLKRTAAVIRPYRRRRILDLIVKRLGFFAGIRSPTEPNGRIGRVCVQSIRLHSDNHIGPDGAPTLRNLLIENLIWDRIETFRRANERWFYVVMKWTWRIKSQTEAEDSTGFEGHMTLLVVDTVDQTYDVWDPNGGQWLVYNDVKQNVELFDLYDAFIETAHDLRSVEGFLAGYTFSGRRHPSLPAGMIHGTVQNALDGVCHKQTKRKPGHTSECPLPPSGLCATSCLLILALCVRFNTGYPHWFDSFVYGYLVEPPPPPNSDSMGFDAAGARSLSVLMR